MADLSDVMNTLADIITAIIYPNGSSQPSAVIVNGAAQPFAIETGWPVPGRIDTDLKGLRSNISVYAPPGMETNTTRYPRDWEVTARPAKTITATVDSTGTQVTFGGTISLPQNTGLIVNGKPYLHPVVSGDTLASIASALAVLVNVDTPASASGSVITIPGAKQLVARVGIVATAQREVRRTNRLFQIVFWCPALPGVSASAVRDAAVSLVDPILAVTNFITLPDGSKGRLLYTRSTMSDGNEKAGCYRRDLFYMVEFATTQTIQAPEVIIAEGIVQGAAITFDKFTPSNPPPYTIIA